MLYQLLHVSEQCVCNPVRVARSLEIFSSTFCFSRDSLRWTTFTGVRRGGKTGNWDKEPKILRKSEVNISIPIIRFNSCINTLFTSMALTLNNSQLHCSAWCDAVMSLQFTHVHSAYRLTLRNLRTHCSTASRSCVTITWQRIFNGSLPVTIINAFFGMWLLTSDFFGRWYSYRPTMTADNGKTRCFIL